MSKKPPHSFVDVLAEELSRKTGSKFEVLRHMPLGLPVKSPGPILYSLRATRGEYSCYFYGMRHRKIDDMKRILASLNDMLSMGFIQTPEHFPGVIYRDSSPTDTIVVDS